MGGEGSPRSYLPALLFGVFVRAMVALVAVVILALLANGLSHYLRPEPTAAERFGCEHSYINARGEDTGECQ